MAKIWKENDKAFIVWVSAYDTSVKEVTLESIKNHTACCKIENGMKKQCLLSALFETQKEAIRALQNMHQEKINKYKSEIHNVEELIQFSFKHTVSLAEEYTDWEARQAYIERTQELTGLSLV